MPEFKYQSVGTRMSIGYTANVVAVRVTPIPVEDDERNSTWRLFVSKRGTAARIAKGLMALHAAGALDTLNGREVLAQLGFVKLRPGESP